MFYQSNVLELSFSFDLMFDAFTFNFCLEIYVLLIRISIQLHLSYLFQTVKPYHIETHRDWMDK